jgi:glycosyltransferase A (GT-A) superfamily protein (DUF2064 family)
VSVGLAIFVKTPGLSPIKTRLAAGLGATQAEACYRLSLAAVQEVAAAAQARDRAITVYFAVAEEAAVDAPDWRALPCLAQRDGGLGERMAQVHGELVARHGAGLLIGADAAQIDPELLTRAAAWLAAGAPRLALGPARDGGFWLFGANRAIPRADWTSVAYSRAETATEFRAAMSRHGEWLELPQLTDFDRAGDAADVARELAALPAPLPAQRALLDWLRTRHRIESAA